MRDRELKKCRECGHTRFVRHGCCVVEVEIMRDMPDPGDVSYADMIVDGPPTQEAEFMYACADCGEAMD